MTKTAPAVVLPIGAFEQIRKEDLDMSYLHVRSVTCKQVILVSRNAATAVACLEPRPGSPVLSKCLSIYQFSG